MSAADTAEASSLPLDTTLRCAMELHIEELESIVDRATTEHIRATKAYETALTDEIADDLIPIVGRANVDMHRAHDALNAARDARDKAFPAEAARSRADGAFLRKVLCGDAATAVVPN